MKTTNISSRMILSISVSLVLFACSKSNNNSTPIIPVAGNSYLSYTDVSPTTNTYGVYSDNTNIFPNGTVGYGTSTGVPNGNPYETISDSMHSIYTTNNGVRTNVDSAYAFQNNGYYSILSYDTGSMAKTLVLNDNLTAPASGEAEIRFLNLSSYGQAVNILLIDSNNTPGNDSVQLNNVSYAGASGVIADSLGTFHTITPGTYKVLVNSSANTNLYTRDTLSFVSGGIYTVYSEGYLNGNNGSDSLNIGVMRNR